MCDPILMAASQLAVGIASTGAGYMAERQAAKGQQEYARQTAVNASRAAEAQYDALNVRAVQEDMATSQQRQEQAIATAQGAAAIETAAAAGGVSGLSVDHVLRDYYGQAGRRSSAISTNQQMARGYLQGEKRSAQAGAQGQANSVPIAETPSPLPAVVGIFGQGLSAYSTYKQQKSRT